MKDEELLEIIIRIGNIPKDSICLNTEFDDIFTWDSLCWLNLALELETWSSIENIIENVELLKTPQDVLRLLHK